MNPSSLYSEIKKSVSLGQTKNALDMLLSGIKNKNNDLENQVNLQQANFHQNERAKRLGIIRHEEAQVVSNRLIHAVLEILEEAKELGLLGPLPSDSGLELQKNKVILFFAANPQYTHPLRLDKEVRDIEDELNKSRNKDKIKLIKLSAIRISDLQDSLLEHSPEFVHFAGHGTEEGIILLGDDDNEKIVKSESFAELFRLFDDVVQCVFLNSCYSESQASVIKQYIPNVIGMKKEVGDNTAIEFAKAFYKGIVAGKDVRFSFEFAKNSIDLNDIPGKNVPVFLEKS
jgi:hypothetical protein